MLVPCYTELVEIVAETVWAAHQAEMPPGSESTVWLLDDGQDEYKAAWVAGLATPRIRYLSGRRRPPGAQALAKILRMTLITRLLCSQACSFDLRPRGCVPGLGFRKANRVWESHCVGVQNQQKVRLRNTNGWGSKPILAGALGRV